MVLFEPINSGFGNWGAGLIDTKETWRQVKMPQIKLMIVTSQPMQRRSEHRARAGFHVKGRFYFVTFLKGSK